MTTIYFVRHAEPNYENHDDTFRELSTKGMQDRKLVTQFLSDKQIDVVLSSPYKRAIDTVADFADTYGFQIKTIDNFKERKVDNIWIDDFTSFCKAQWEDFDYKLSDGETLGEVMVLLLLHTLSAVNFVRFILENELPEDNPYLFKVKYITMYYALGSVNKVSNYYSSNNIVLNPNVLESLKSILINSEVLLNSDFRSCMMHYEFINKGKYLIKDEYLNCSVPFYGLIQTFFNGMNYSDFNKILTDKIIHISDSIENLLKISNDNLKKL